MDQGMTPKPPEFFEATEMPTAGWWEALWPEPGKVIIAAGIRPGMRIVDLCSGDGWFTLQIAKIARHVIAIDIDASLLEVARKRLAEASVTNCTCTEGDAYQLPMLVEGQSDLVFMANAFHGVPNKTRLARRVRESLKPTGRFAIVNWHSRPREDTPVLGEPRGPRTELRLSPQQTAAAVEPAGFKLAELTEIPPYHYCAVFTPSHGRRES
jgi:ubiquinone/menaquinone biosynthesis C-methylase UbiE